MYGDVFVCSLIVDVANRPLHADSYSYDFVIDDRMWRGEDIDA